MSVIAEYLLLSIVGCLFIAYMRVSSWRPWALKRFEPKDFIPFKFQQHPSAADDSTEGKIRDIMKLAERHETASRLADLVQKDGAGTWPPRANHAHMTWPAALRPYREIYYEMAPLLPAAEISLDDDVNTERITTFRTRFQKLLTEKVNLHDVTQLLEAADAGRWDVFPRDAYNAFYCCMAWCRHAYR